MSVGAKHWALAQKVEGGSSPRVVLFYLADWIIGANQTECWPSLDTLAFETGMNRQTIMKATASLEKQGLITKRAEWLRSDKSLKKRVVYRLNGYVPSEWVKSKRPEAPDSTKSRTSEKPYVQDLEPTENNTFDGTKSHTFEGTKNRTFDGTKFRTGTEIDKKEQEEEQVFVSRTSSTSAEKQNDSIPDDVPSWVTDTPSSDSYSEVASTAGGSSVSDCGSAVSSREDTFELTPNEPPAKPAPKAKPKTSRRKPKISCPFTPGDALSDDLLSWAVENYPTIDARAEFQNFINSALANDRRYSDWNAAFRNWCGNALRYQNQNGGNSARQPYKRDTTRFAHEWRQEDRVYGSEEGLKEMLAYLEEHGEKISA